jgi:3-phenylpropionate/cinnamic acid dioxygenase small subunit
MDIEATKDFFTSYNRYDRAWAKWFAWMLEAASYGVKP